MTSLAALLFLCVVAVTSGQMSIDLRTGVATDGFNTSNGMQWHVWPPAVPQNTECNVTGVLKVTFNRNKHRRLRLVMSYAPYPTEYHIQLGDSESNSNQAGDRGHQSNDANIHIYQRDVYVFTRDLTTSQYELLHNNKGFVNNTLVIELMDGLVTLRSGENFMYLKTDKLFAVAGQPDREGKGPNYDVFVAMNRLVSSHQGTGLCSVSFTWLSNYT